MLKTPSAKEKQAIRSCRKLWTKEKLFDADPECLHKIEEKLSGIRCVKCGGWFRF